MKRRHLLASAAGLLGGGFLAACAKNTGGSTPAVTPPQVTPASVAMDVSLIAQSLNAALPSALPTLGIATAVAGTITTALNDLKAAAQAIVTADTPAAASPIVARVEADVNAVVMALNGVSLPATLANVLQAAGVLLPVIEAAVGMIVAVGAQLHGMSVAKARETLARAAR